MKRLVYLLFCIILTSLVSAANYNITERTDYGILINSVYLKVCDNVGKAQNINISSVFKDDSLTRVISFGDVYMNQSYNYNLLGEGNISIGKYTTTNVSTDCVTNVNGTVCKNTTHYYDNDDSEMFCANVKADKTCNIIGKISLGNETRYGYLLLPTVKDKIVIGGAKIEQKSSGIPLPKDGCVDVRYSYNHSLVYTKLPTADVNKYNISVVGDDGSQSKIDPTWWNNTLTQRYVINCTLMTDGLPIVINGTYGVTINGIPQFIWTVCNNSDANQSLYYLDNKTYAVASNDIQYPMDVESGNGTSYNPTGVWTNYDMVVHFNDYTAINGTQDNVFPMGVRGSLPALRNTARIGGGVVLDNSNTFQSNTSAPWFNKTFWNWTWTVWINSTALANYDGIINVGGYNGGDASYNTEQLDSSGRMYTYFQPYAGRGYSGEGPTATGVVVNNWYLVTQHWNGTHFEVYINKTRKFSGTTTNTGKNLSGPFMTSYFNTEWHIGSYTYADSPIRGFNGVIDEVQFGPDRTWAQINQTYDNVYAVPGYGTIGANESGGGGTPVTNSCTYSGSGNWAINCSDSCNLTATNMLRLNFTIIGITANQAGVYGFSNITNYTFGRIENCLVRG